MVMPVDLKQGLDAHPEIAGCLERIDARLHEPSGRDARWRLSLVGLAL
jgi:hypothetical protein